MRRAASGGSGRWVRYAVGLPVAFKLGLDLGNLVPPLQSHYVEEEREKKTDVWNAVGDDVMAQLTSNPTVRQRLGERVQVSDVLTLSKSHLRWQFLTYCPPEKHESSQWWDAVTDFRVVMATEELQLKVPVKSGRKGSSATHDLMVDTHNDGRGWQVQRAWVETHEDNPTCIPLSPV